MRNIKNIRHLVRIGLINDFGFWFDSSGSMTFFNFRARMKNLRHFDTLTQSLWVLFSEYHSRKRKFLQTGKTGPEQIKSEKSEFSFPSLITQEAQTAHFDVVTIIPASWFDSFSIFQFFSLTQFWMHQYVIRQRRESDHYELHYFIILSLVRLRWFSIVCEFDHRLFFLSGTFHELLSRDC